MYSKDEIERLAREAFKADCGQIIIGKRSVSVYPAKGTLALFSVHHDRAAEAALAALNAMLPPAAIEPDPEAPRHVPDLPGFWTARRAAQGKGPSRCAMELLIALDERRPHFWEEIERDQGDGAEQPTITERCKGCGETRKRPAIALAELLLMPKDEPQS